MIDEPLLARWFFPAAIGLIALGCASPTKPLRSQKLVLAPTGMMQPLLTGAPQTAGMHSGHVLLKPGEAMHRHSTEDNEELLVFLAGRARVVLGSEPVEMAAGEVLYIPPHTEHEVHNDGTEVVRYVFVVAKAR